MTYRMAANAIFNKLNAALSMVGVPVVLEQMRRYMEEARALADSIVRDEHSGEEHGPRSAASGIGAYIVQRCGVPDLFEWEPSQVSFPCCACKHGAGPVEHCEGCSHYAM